ncbi:hypothetical protein [Erythrobacter sp. QSSC1-22B]|uniref:hypothetical protein n=1 Tax=Erythrobacter sp. QSSC1-22B TaxID=1860125 RepID=UPI0011A61F14|nr:hypothetical protein [Erythrobacter sp. QSSC1-22B]
MDQELSTDEAKTKTAELLNVDESDLDYITEEYLQEDASEIPDDDKGEFRSWYGWDMSYGSRNGRPTYEFRSNSNWSLPVCGAKSRYYLYQHNHDHSSTGQRCTSHNNSAVLKFTLRR